MKMKVSPSLVFLPLMAGISCQIVVVLPFKNTLSKSVHWYNSVLLITLEAFSVASCQLPEYKLTLASSAIAAYLFGRTLSALL
ncbi:hypothetical protein D3C72_1358480 [compost metagenome]